MDDYKDILQITAYLLEYPDEEWRQNFSECRAAAEKISSAQIRDVLRDYFEAS